MSSEIAERTAQQPELVQHDLSPDDPAADAVESFLTARQLAEKLQVSADWIYDQASSGSMPSYRIGSIRRFRISEIEDWLQGHREPRGLGGLRALSES